MKRDERRWKRHHPSKLVMIVEQPTKLKLNTTPTLASLGMLVSCRSKRKLLNFVPTRRSWQRRQVRKVRTTKATRKIQEISKNTDHKKDETNKDRDRGRRDDRRSKSRTGTRR